jgi:PAS domain S-box-containing protein
MEDLFQVGPVVAVCWKNEPDWPVVRISRNIVDLAGIPADALVSGKIQYVDLIHPDDRPRIISEVERHLASGAGFYQQEYRLIHTDGTHRWVHDVTQVVRDGGEVTHLQGYLLDITPRKQAEASLAESRAQYADLVESQHAGIYRIRVSRQGDWTSTTAPAYAYEFASPQYCDLFGVSREELLANPGLTLSQVHPQDLAGFVRLNKEANRTLEPFIWEGRMIIGGRTRWIRFESRSRKLNDAEVLWTGVALDIDVTRQADEALKERERNLREAQRIAEIGSWEFDAATDRLRYSEEMYRILGIVREKFSHTTDGFLELVHPDDRPAMAQWAADHLAGRDPREMELRILRPDGTIRHVLGRGSAFRDDQGRVTRVLGTAQDITERRRALEALRESEERYRTLAEAAHDMIFIINREDRVEYVNRYAAQSIGRRPEEIIGQPRSKLFPSHVADHQGQSLRQVFETGKPYYVESTIPTPSRNTQLGTWLVPMRRDGGTVKTVLGVSRDITEQKLMEERLRQAQKMEAVGQLAGGVAHDFNNQLVGILGFADLLSRRLEDEQLRAYAQQIVSSAKRSSDLTRQLLAFARKGKYLATSVDLHAIIAEVVALLERSIDKRIVIKPQLQARLHTVMGDPTQLHNAILNLGVNARDAMPDGGELVFETSVIEVGATFGQTLPLEIEPGTYLEILVRDTGVGMSDEILARIFEPFFTTKEPGKGTGMGLAAVYGTVRSHHGAITVQSTSGEGSLFRIILPLASPAGPEADRAGAASAQPRSAHVLVVDDEAVVRTLVAEQLHTMGHRVTLCRDGLEALEFYHRSWNDVDLVILDMVMPRMSGRDLFLSMRRVNPGVRALLASGFSINGEAQTILHEGVLGFVQKPFTVDDLGNAVSMALK